MSKKTAVQPEPKSRPEDWDVCWFAKLADAHRLSDYEAAHEATKQLERLGWIVRRKEGAA